MINKELQDKQKKAWDLMIDKGLKMGEAMFIRSAYASNYKDEYPFIDIQYKKGEVEYYHSSIRTKNKYTMITIYSIIILMFVVEILFHPRIDVNTQTNQYLLWYNWFGQRKYIEI